MFFGDNGYSRAAAEYERHREEECCDCTPKVIRTFKNEDGMDDGEMNCHYCDCEECEYWSEYNSKEN